MLPPSTPKMTMAMSAIEIETLKRLITGPKETEGFLIWVKILWGLSTLSLVVSQSLPLDNCVICGNTIFFEKSFGCFWVGLTSVFAANWEAVNVLSAIPSSLSAPNASSCVGLLAPSFGEVLSPSNRILALPLILTAPNCETVGKGPSDAVVCWLIFVASCETVGNGASVVEPMLVAAVFPPIFVASCETGGSTSDDVASKAVIIPPTFVASGFLAPNCDTSYIAPQTVENFDETLTNTNLSEIVSQFLPSSASLSTFWMKLTIFFAPFFNSFFVCGGNLLPKVVPTVVTGFVVPPKAVGVTFLSNVVADGCFDGDFVLPNVVGDAITVGDLWWICFGVTNGFSIVVGTSRVL
uniref:Uncharacterized protein n=1 Tax=Romanomermis culicivorax TaxID=13658 RepID=A0A915J1Z9_ROMCU